MNYEIAKLTNTDSKQLISKIKQTRAPKLGEILNLFTMTEEAEEKALFNSTEKDFTLRILENHLFPKKINSNQLNKFYHLLKNKDPNYSLKRKYLKEAKVESNEEGNFRLTLSKSFYQNLISKGEVKFNDKKIIDMTNKINKEFSKRKKNNIFSLVISKTPVIEDNSNFLGSIKDHNNKVTLEEIESMNLITENTDKTFISKKNYKGGLKSLEKLVPEFFNKSPQKRKVSTQISKTNETMSMEDEENESEKSNIIKEEEYKDISHLKIENKTNFYSQIDNNIFKITPKYNECEAIIRIRNGIHNTKLMDSIHNCITTSDIKTERKNVKIFLPNRHSIKNSSINSQEQKNTNDTKNIQLRLPQLTNRKNRIDNINKQSTPVNYGNFFSLENKKWEMHKEDYSKSIVDVISNITKRRVKDFSKFNPEYKTFKNIELQTLNKKK